MTAPDRSWMFRWSAYSQGAQFIVNFVASVIIARMLGPAELGAYSVAIAAVILAQVLRLAGINSFLIQEKELTKSKVASAFGLACGFGVILGIIIIAIRHHIADFYHSPAIASVLLVAGFTYFATPFQIIGMGVRSRELHVPQMAFAAIAASIASAAVSLLLVFAGHGAVSLAWGELAGSLLSSAMVWWRAPDIMMTRPSFGGWGAIWRVSGWALGSQLLTQLGARTNELVIGKTLGVTQAALFDRGEMLPRLVWSYIAPPILHLLAPMMASDVRAGHDIRQLTCARIRLFACIFGPALMALATQARPLVLTLYGAQWAASIVPATWLCLSAAVVGQFVVLNSALAAIGRTRDLFAIVVVEQGARLIILLLLARTDIHFIAMGMLAVAFAYSMAASTIARRAGVITFGDLARNLRPGVVVCAAVLAAGEAALSIASWAGLGQLPTLIFGTIATAAIGCVTLFFAERDVLRALVITLLRRNPGF